MRSSCSCKARICAYRRRNPVNSAFKKRGHMTRRTRMARTSDSRSSSSSLGTRGFTSSVIPGLEIGVGAASRQRRFEDPSGASELPRERLRPASGLAGRGDGARRLCTGSDASAVGGCCTTEGPGSTIMPRARRISVDVKEKGVNPNDSTYLVACTGSGT